MKTCRLFLFILFLAFASVSSKAQNGNKYFIDSLDIKLSNWRKDSLGCLGLRNRYYFEFWQNLHHYLESDTALCTILLGKPNNKKIEQDKVLYIYYFSTRCKGESIDENLAPNYLIVAYKKDNTFIDIWNENH
jgi:hypothetical protein